MLAKANADYRCGGYPTPTYNGSIQVSLNIHQDATDGQVEDELAAKAKRLVAHKMCMDTALVAVTGLSGIETTLADYELDRIHA
jgi:hypothetical protein